MPRAAVLTIALLLLVGCASTAAPGNSEPPAPLLPPSDALAPKGSPILPPPPDSPSLARSGGQVVVSGIATVGRPYLWSPRGDRIAFQDDGGVWALSPDGEVAEPVAAGAKYRELVGWTEEGGLVYLEALPEGLAVAVGRPGQPPREVAVLTDAQAGAPGRPLWRHLAGNRLVVAAEGLPVWHINVETGSVRMLTERSLPVHYGWFAVSPDGNTLAFKVANRADPVRLLNLESGTLLEPAEDEAHLSGLGWAPGHAGDMWAVRAAAPGSGLPAAVGANAVEGATHLVVGDSSGRLRRLEPPEPLQLTAGPFWSPDGRWIAVAAGVARGTEGGKPSEFRHSGVWLVAVESGEWRRLGGLSDGWVAGWHPDGRRLLVHADGARVESWPTEGGAAQAAPYPWRPSAAEPLPDGGFVYLSLDPEPRVLLQHGDSAPVPVVDGPGHKEQLTVRGDYAAVVVWVGGDRPRLVLTRMVR